MTNSIHLPTDTTKLKTLVNADRIRSSVKRLFRNRIDEVLSELFQNSQRSGSTTIDITTTDNTFIIQDNGHGLLNGIDGFHTLLKLAESNFDNETIEAQDPMGLGIVSLLTHDQVTSVTFTSGDLELTIDTKRWWNDPVYYSTWYERIVTLDQYLNGLRITVTSTPELIKALHSALEPKDHLYTLSDDPYKSASPAQGYEGILKITLNSTTVRTKLPRWTTLTHSFISTTYKGSKLEIRYDAHTNRSSILWYGQLIIQHGLANCFQFHLEVKSGRPVNPQSPTRAGIIQDVANDELLGFIKAQIFQFIFDPSNRSKITPEHVEGCYKLDRAYSIANCPYIVAEAIQTSDNPNSFDEFNGTAHSDPNPDAIFGYDELPLLLNDQVCVELPSGTSDAEYGLQSFLRETGPAYKIKHGNHNKIRIGTLWWRPKGQPTYDWFHQPGEYGISYEDNAPPDNWSSITNSPVFVFNYTASYDLEEAEFLIGTTGDPTDFLRNQAWAAFSANDDDDYHSQQESYQNSIDDFIRAIIGKCVPKDFKLYEISRFLKDPAAPIISINFHYKTAGKFVNPRRVYKANSHNTAAMLPAEITVKTSTGEKVRLKLY